MEPESPIEAAPEAPAEPKKPGQRKVAAEKTDTEPDMDIDPSA
jgi:hypothetical protein